MTRLLHLVAYAVIPWMSWAALVEAIPPAYTEHIGGAAMLALSDAEVAAYGMAALW